MAWNGSNKHVKETITVDMTGAGRRHFVRVGLVGFVVVTITLALLWFVADRDGKNHSSRFQKDKSSAIADVGRKIVKPKQLVKPTLSNQTNANTRYEHGVIVVAVNARTNSAGAVIERLTLADGRRIQKVHPAKPLFDNASDQLIAMALSVRPGQSMPPFPNLSSIDKDFMKSLLDPIRIMDTDSAEDRDLKLAVKEARAYIAAEIKNGRTVQECLLTYRDDMEKICDSHTMAVQEIQKMREEGVSVDEINAFRERVNEVFKEKGIPELPTHNSNESLRRHK